MRLRPMTRADIPACVTIATNGFIDDRFNALLAPGRHEHPGGWRKFYFEKIRQRFVQRGYWCVVCVQDHEHDSGGSQEEILGIALWHRCTSADPSSPYAASEYLRNNGTLSAGLERLLYTCEDEYNFQLHTNPALDHKFCGLFRSAGPSPLYAPLHDYWELSHLSVAPQHHRKGVGAMLLGWGLQRCREEASPPLPAVLISSSAGQALYASRGFKVMTWLGEELNIGGGAVMVWDDAGKWTVALEGRKSKNGSPIEVALRGGEEEIDSGEQVGGEAQGSNDGVEGLNMVDLSNPGREVAIEAVADIVAA